MKPQYLLGIDQGGSGSRAVILDAHGVVVGYGYQSVDRIYPRPGWVEQSHHTIASSVQQAISAALAHAGIRAKQIAACGITSQRDTVFAWDTATSEPIGNAITWQDLRTTALVAETNRWEHATQRRERLGQFPGAYSSSMHLAWRMRHDPAFRQAAEAGTLRCTLAAGWIVQSLGKLYANQLDFSLTQGMTILDVRQQRWWDEWIDYLQLPRVALPEPMPTLHSYGELYLSDADGERAVVPVLAMIADQQAALFGYDCRLPGQTACTHGTNSFINACVGHAAPPQGACKTYLAWHLDNQPTYTLEADTTVTGAVVRWMQEQMGWLKRPADLDRLALSVPDSGGVVFVPAFTGFGVPSEDRSARGTLLGMTLDTNPAHIARAFLESIGLQVRAILETIKREANLQVHQLHVGGGVSASDAACQIQADLIGVPVVRAHDTETSVRAAALLAGLGAGIWRDQATLPPLDPSADRFEPQSNPAYNAHLRELWEQAVARSQHWAME
jgi:glycerol kinase